MKDLYAHCLAWCGDGEKETLPPFVLKTLCKPILAQKHRFFCMESKKGVNGGVKVSHLAEQKCTTYSLYSQDHPGCQAPILL